jgi:hemolysin activation/secretion protein
MKLSNYFRWLGVFCAFFIVAGPAAAESPVRVTTTIPLRGIVLRQALHDFVATGVEGAGLDFAASPVASADPVFRAKAEALLGQPITIALLQSLSSEVVLAYRRAGRPLADAAVPEQNISNGTVQVIILEAHLGRVSVEGASHFSAERILAALRTRPGEPLYAGTLFSDLDWLNQNSFRRIDLVYERGQDLSTTDVTLRVTEQRPWQAFAGYDNENVESLGRDRWFAGVRAGNLWGREHQSSLLYTQARDANVYQGVALDYTVPLPRPRQLLTLLASYAEPAVSDPTFDSIGQSWRLGLRYGGEFSRTRLWQISWAAGYDARSSNNDILFGGTNVFSGAYQTHELVGELSARRPGPAGETTLKATMYYSPGNIGTKNSSADLSSSGRTEVDAHYAFADLTAGHKFSLPREYTLGFAGSLRLTNDRLPPSSEFSLGGVAQLPGYTEATALGDTSAWAQVRLQSPIYHVLQKTSLASSDAIRFSALYSLGQVSINDLTAVEVSQGLREQRKLESVGVGATYEYSRHFQFNFVYGWQLRSPATGVERSSRGHVSAVLTF